MTIHQAKGLEFPVVILPFMDTPIFPSVNEKIWFPFSEGKLKRIKWGWFNFSKELEHFGNKGEAALQGKMFRSSAGRI
jgi:superfamily I DNA/RNA helicase